MKPVRLTARSWLKATMVDRSTLLIIGLLTPLIVSSAVAQTSPQLQESAVDEPQIDPTEREHWSFKPLVRPSIPVVRDASWPRNAVDQFILSRLEQHDLSPLPSADAGTLIRRVTYDLTGLPPTPQDIRAFVNDTRPNAYDRLVDRLQASDAYGERWAQHWLDLARFAETDGFEHDKVRPNAWRYRDWVIDALNDDLPFNRFVQLQLAGDEIAPDHPAAHIATGFLLCGPDMPDINLQTERRHNFLNEMTSTVGSVLLGLQVGCAQCHDHKFDPISQLDFYRFRAFFDNTALFREHPIASQSQRDHIQKLEQQRSRQWQRTQQDIKQFYRKVRARLAKAGQNLPSVSDQDLQSRFTPQEGQTLAKLNQQLQELKQLKPASLPVGRVMRTRSGKPVKSFSYTRGDFRRPASQVRAGILRILNKQGMANPLPDPQDSDIGQRSQLAYWITGPQNPLLPRVMVNRIWQHHFGRGFSATESDFGIMGDEPTHPLLLDWLACEFRTRQWSLKQLHRLLVTSATYRQASRPTGPDWSESRIKRIQAQWQRNSKLDQDNEFWWRMSRRRLEGEAIRDSMLFLSGRLSQRRGGPGIRPPLPPEQLATLLRNQWPVSPNRQDHTRRSIYLFVRRNLRFPILDTFDKPDTNASCGRRNRSTTAPQALMLLNSRDSLLAAQHLAQRISRKHRDPVEQVAPCFLTVLGRPPKPDEHRIAREFLQRDREQAAGQRNIDQTPGQSQPQSQSQSQQVSHLGQLCLTLFNLNEFIYID